MGVGCAGGGERRAVGQSVRRVYVCVIQKGVAVVSGAVLGAGVILGALNGFTLLIGYKYSMFVMAYIFIMGALALGEVVAAAFFLDPATRPKLLAPFQHDERIYNLMKEHTTIAGYALAGAALVQLVAVGFAVLRARNLSSIQAEDLENSLLEKTRKPAEIESNDEEEGDDGAGGRPASAAERFRMKHKDIYERYGVRR